MILPFVLASGIAMWNTALSAMLIIDNELRVSFSPFFHATYITCCWLLWLVAYYCWSL